MSTPINISQPAIFGAQNTSITTTTYFQPDSIRPILLPFNRNKPLFIPLTAVSSSQTSSEVRKPEIELEFIGPKPGNDGSYPVDNATTTSGDKLLRSIMLDNKIELYATYGKVMNCGGTGTCGTCIVEIVEGNDLLNERTKTELRYLKKKPESWRLACQTIVGNKENSGEVVVQRLPQWKK
ncbi:hypothetical protein vseg_014127 [Gypsophila vaccaria]